MEIYLIRHTTPAISKGLIYGRTDVSLAPECAAECNQIVNKIPPAFDAVYTSPSSRCTYLAEKISQHFITDARLMEVNFGLWEGKTWDTVDQQELAHWMNDFVHASPPGGESMLTMHDRVLAFWNDLLLLPLNRIAIITHGGVIRLIMAALTQTPLASAFTINISYGDIILVDKHHAIHRLT